MIDAVQIKAPRTLEDVIQDPRPKARVELWEGEWIELSPQNYKHSEIVAEFFAQLRDFARSRPGLKALPDNATFVVSRAPDVALIPDGSLFRIRPDSTPPWLRFAPEVAVEVFSPSNTRAEMSYRRSQFFRHGTEQFWLINPAFRMIEVHFPDGRITEVRGGQVMGEGILSGFLLDVTAFFDSLEL